MWTFISGVITGIVIVILFFVCFVYFQLGK